MYVCSREQARASRADDDDADTIERVTARAAWGNVQSEYRRFVPARAATAVRGSDQLRLLTRKRGAADQGRVRADRQREDAGSDRRRRRQGEGGDSAIARGGGEDQRLLDRQHRCA